MILVCLNMAVAMKTKLMYMKRSGLSDLQMSATSYVYGNGGPVSYVYFSQPPKQNLFNLKQQQIIIPVKEEEVKGEENVEGNQSQNGEKSVSNYDTKHAFDKGEKGSYENEDEKKYYLVKGLNKKGFNDAANAYEAKHETDNKSQGEDFSVSGYHKKGQKTTGYHRVYHKDEYKKDREFYDEEDKRGSWKRWGNGNKMREAISGGGKSSGRHEEGQNEEEHGAEGHADRGRNVQAASGHNSAQGREQYATNKDTFATRGDNQRNRLFGFIIKEPKA